ncbi:thiamine pyrophosphate-dependent dehydrogenase E1 component subunit alpha [Paenibacillus sp. N1-5-1-14]|uniref:thiamine pyrophosphate-dependent dehydrogenase E1 component subunit alpha n=1 Tax=Paenibacillus radicibacter TaxID=2972488 RepID=UPI002158CA55|nr:thiamine pyrophosphate-dependent dehydrogenase E1 component subunit alpha [Paenibacillus radicibacter]MCR8642047.1 thiamine pyrophosphate-dependent dehydrogenase E1 component subunit alpha [Paenibacillus radicibacter]
MTIPSRHQQAGLPDDQVIEMYRYMLLTRKLDERMSLLNRAGKIPFFLSCQGQEAAQVGAAFAFEIGKDYACPYYRDLAFVHVFGMTSRDSMLNVFAKAEDPNSGGRQMPGHFGCRKHNIMSASSPVGTQIPHAVGIALGGKLEGKDMVVYVSFGEGTSNQGDFHEGANFAGVHKLPVIFFCENNQYAISVPLHKQLGCESVAMRAQGYGFPGVKVDGNDPIAVYQVVKEAVDRGRRGEGATLIEALMYRINPHSSDDDDRQYRSQDEVAAARSKDPVRMFRLYLEEVGLWNEHKEQALLSELTHEVNDATDYAEKAPFPEPESTLKYVYGN